LRIVAYDEEPFWWGYAPDGHTYAARNKGDLIVCESCTQVAFSPDAQRLAAGYKDGTALVWDLTPEGWQAPAAKATPEQFERLWADLAGADAPRAHCAIYTLAQYGAPALASLREHLQPVPEDYAERLRQRIADLDSDDFRTREQAMRELTRCGPAAVLLLHAALEGKPSPEARVRIETLLKELHPWYIEDAETLRTVRAMWVLQRIGSPEAKALLDKLAPLAPGARLGVTDPPPSPQPRKVGHVWLMGLAAVLVAAGAYLVLSRSRWRTGPPGGGTSR
jgi:hypothetical protein